MHFSRHCSYLGFVNTILQKHALRSGRLKWWQYFGTWFVSMFFSKYRKVYEEAPFINTIKIIISCYCNSWRNSVTQWPNISVLYPSTNTMNKIKSDEIIVHFYIFYLIIKIYKPNNHLMLGNNHIVLSFPIILNQQTPYEITAGK